MNDLAPRLPRKPFGYDPAAVDQMLSERDTMLGLAERRVQAAEARVAALEEQLRTREAAVADLSSQLAAIAAQPDVPEITSEPEPESEPLTPRFMTEELSKIVMAAEASTTQILERAWMSTREQIVEADRLWGEVQTEIVRFATWRDEAEAVVDDLQSHLDQAKTKIESVPRRIQEALSPAVEAMVAVDEGMARFAQASTLPLLLTPSGLEAARARAESMGDLLSDQPPGEEPYGSDQQEDPQGDPYAAQQEPDPYRMPDDLFDNGLYDESREDPVRALSMPPDDDSLAAEVSEELRDVQGPDEPHDPDDRMSENSPAWGG